MAPMRTYGDACRTAHALDLVGERWALLIVRELLLGPKRFTDLRAGLRGASPDVLAQRLRELEAAGVLRKRRLGPPVGTSVYELTDWGAELEPVVVALGRWGSRSPLADDELEMSVDAHAIALKADFDQDAAGDLEAIYELRLAGESFRVEVSDREISVARGEADDQCRDRGRACSPGRGSLGRPIAVGRSALANDQARRERVQRRGSSTSSPLRCRPRSKPLPADPPSHRPTASITSWAASRPELLLTGDQTPVARQRRAPTIPT